MKFLKLTKLLSIREMALFGIGVDLNLGLKKELLTTASSLGISSSIETLCDLVLLGEAFGLFDVLDSRSELCRETGLPPLAV